MFTTLLNILSEFLVPSVYGKTLVAADEAVDDDAADVEDETDSQDDADEEEDDIADADTDADEEVAADTPAPAPQVQMYPAETVKRLRAEAKSRRQKQRAAEARAKKLEQQYNELRREKAQTANIKKAAAASRESEEIERLKEQISSLSSERDQLAELQSQTQQVLTIGKVASELGFADPADAVAFVSNKSEQFTDATGEVDMEALRSELEELLESKPYLAAMQINERKAKEKKARVEAAKTDNPPSKQNIRPQEVKKENSDEATDQKIKQLLNKQRDGSAALKVWLAEKYLPKTGKEYISVS